jgi:hypothetical protein
MSRAALKNPDRRRDIREIEIPPHVQAILEPDSRAFFMGRCRIIVAQGPAGWHLSISKPDKLPTWEEVRDARYALIPDKATMALLLPPSAEYVNVQEFTLHLHEIPGEEL